MEYIKVKGILGKKFYSSEKEDGTIDILRVISIKNEKEVLVEFNNDTENTKKISPEELYEKYTELIPDGFMTFSIVKMKKVSKDLFVDDVIICTHKTNELSSGNNDPAIICRQNITDFFYNYISNTENHTEVGVSVSRQNCPANLDYSIMRACDDVSYFIGINFYISDNIESILNIIGNKIKKFDGVLENGLKDFLKTSNIPDIGQIQSHGWCRNLKTLLINNDFEYDYNSIFNIVPIGLLVKDHLIDTKDDSGEYVSLDEFLIKNFSDLYRINITKTVVVKYDHDIDLDEILGKYFMCRDKDNNLYVIMYTTEGEYFDTDLAVIAAKNMMLQSGILNSQKYKK